MATSSSRPEKTPADVVEPRKAAPPAKTTAAAKPAGKTFTEHATGFAGNARSLAEKLRRDVAKLREDVQAYYEKAAPENHEAPVHTGMSRLMSTVDDLDRAVDGIMQTAADLDRTASEATPPDDRR